MQSLPAIYWFYIDSCIDIIRFTLQQLVDQCLSVLDPELSLHLKSKGLSAELYAFAPILTFSAGTPPLDEVLRLWDFFLAFGVHLNVLSVIAQLHTIRTELLAETRYVQRSLRVPVLRLV